MSCKCYCCGKLYKVDLNIPDELWKIIKPKDKSFGGLLCGSCIMDKLENISSYDYWFLNKEVK